MSASVLLAHVSPLSSLHRVPCNEDILSFLSTHGVSLVTQKSPVEACPLSVIARAVLRVELRVPAAVLPNQLVFFDEEWA